MSRHYHSLLNVLTSAAFSYAKSSYHQGEADPTPTITGTPGGTFSATPSGLSINTSTGTIDLDNSTIQSYTITYTVSGVSSSQSLAVTASPFLANTYSMDFDGTSYIDVSDKFNFIHNTKEFTISLWLKMDSYNATVSSVLVGNNYTGSNIGFQFWIDNRQNGTTRTNALKFNLWDGTNTAELAQDSVVVDNNWNHFVVTADGTTLKYYKNGSQLTDTDSLPSSTSTTGFANLRLAANTNTPIASYLDGKLDEVAVWNTALSADAITEIYNATNNNTGKALDLSTDSGNYS